MTPLEAIEPTFVVPGFKVRWSEHLELLLRMLHAVTVAEHPYAYLVTAELRPHRARD